MGYRKFSADYLFTGHAFAGDDCILITDEKGEVINLVRESEAGEGIEKFEGILSPGFINAHCHLELSHLRNRIPEGTGLVDFVYKVVMERHFDPDEMIEAAQQAEDAMLDCGIVAAGDICNGPVSFPQKMHNRLQYYNFIETSGWHPDVAASRFERSKSLYDECIQQHLQASIVPHAPYSVSENLWGKITPFFRGKVISIHNQETKEEDSFFLNGTGKLAGMYQKMQIDNSFYQFPGLRSPETYFRKLSGAASVLLVHNTFIEPEDLTYINATRSPDQLVSFCLCVNANLYIENRLPPVKMLWTNGCHLVIGTDSLASNHGLNVLGELKTISINFPSIPLEELLRWATVNGARALQMDQSLGSFEKGKCPGIVVIENVPGKKITPYSIAKRIL